MNRKIVYIILVALAILLLFVLLWFWFLRKEGAAVQTTGTFGTAQNATKTNSGSQGQTNIGSALPNQQTSSTTSTQTNIELGNVGISNSGAGVTGGGTAISGFGNPITDTPGQVGVANVTWLSGTPGGTTQTNTNSNAGTVFNPTAINSIANSNPSGTGLTPNIGADGQQITGGGGGGLGLGGTVGIAALAGAISCGASTAISLAAQALGFSTATGAAATAQATAATTGAALAALSVSTVNVGLQGAVAASSVTAAGTAGTSVGAENGAFQVNTFMGCIARTIAKVAISQITNSVVNWINSGFNGSPSFVQNPTKFFQQTADQAAGAFIQSSALSFLCSPFQLQIKIAIAQSYANRNNASSCTLTQVTKNIQNFMAGNFLSGNWAGMLSFTNVPTNNPYGAFLYGSIAIGVTTNTATQQKQTDLAQGQGFLSFQQEQNCHNVGEDQLSGNNVGPNKTFKELPGPNAPGQATQYSVCDKVTTTPGTVIQNALIGTNNSSLNSLNLAKSFDEIISALISQLLTRTLQSGLSNLSGAGGYSANFYSPDQIQAQSSAQSILTQMQAATSIAAQYAQVQQGSIGDVEDAQSRLNDLYNCFNNVPSTSPQSSKAIAYAAQASSTLASLNKTVDAYNNRITLANNAIVLLEQLQSAALSAQSTADVTTISSNYSAAQSAGKIPTQSDVTSAQQNRTTLQSQMSALNNQTEAALQQCNAL